MIVREKKYLSKIKGPLYFLRLDAVEHYSHKNTQAYKINEKNHREARHETFSDQEMKPWPAILELIKKENRNERNESDLGSLTRTRKGRTIFQMLRQHDQSNPPLAFKKR